MKRSILETHSAIRNILFFLIIAVLSLFFFLKNGISIEHLKLGALSADGLYLKLDKKLILKADRLVIPANKKQHALPDLEEGLDRFNEILRYFEYIELKAVTFENDHYSLLYTDHIFYMANDHFEVATHRIVREGDEIHALIDLIYLKEYDIRLSGKLVYNYKRDNALMKGEAGYKDIKVDFLLNKRKKNLYFVMKSNTFTQLKPLIDQFSIPPKISVWITDRVKAEHYRLERLTGRAKIEKGEIAMIPRSLSGEALLSRVTIDFQKEIAPVKAKRVKVSFKNDTLHFDLVRPYFRDKSLSGSHVAITNLTNRKPVVLELDLKFNSRLDADLLKILESYHIDLPLSQPAGSIESKLKIEVDLKTKATHCSCDFVPRSGKIEIGNFPLPVQKGLVHVEDGKVTLSGVLLKGPGYRAEIDGTIKLDKKQADLVAMVHRLDLGEEKHTYFSMRETKLPVRISFRKDILIALPTLKVKIAIDKNSGKKVIELKEIAALKKYLSGLPIVIDGGRLTIRSNDLERFRFEGLLKRNDCIIYRNDSTCLTQMPVSGSLSNGQVIVTAFGGAFRFDSSKSLITLNHLNLDLERFFDTLDSPTAKKKRVGKKLRIYANHSTLRYGRSKLVTDRYDLGILPNGDFRFRGSLGPDKVTLTMKRKHLEIIADHIGDRMLHPLINFSGIQKGKYSLRMSGVPGKMMTGTIRVDHGILSSFKAYNNLLAFINTVPALASLSSPGFSDKGFVIDQGLIKFTVYKGDVLTFDSILIKGKSATISGEGTVDLKTKKINVDLAIQTSRGIGSLIGDLPVVGYILTGKNKSIMTVGLHIGGTLERPITKTSPIKDVLLLPFRMIERTFNPPKR